VAHDGADLANVRCHRLVSDFRPAQPKDLTASLRVVANQESSRAEPDPPALGLGDDFGLSLWGLTAKPVERLRLIQLLRPRSARAAQQQETGGNHRRTHDHDDSRFGTRCRQGARRGG